MSAPMADSERCTVVEYGVIRTAVEVVVHKVRNEVGEDFWRVILHRTSGTRLEEIVQRDYLAWSRETPEGKLPDDAAADLFGIEITA